MGDGTRIEIDEVTRIGKSVGDIVADLNRLSTAAGSLEYVGLDAIPDALVPEELGSIGLSWRTTFAGLGKAVQQYSTDVQAAADRYRTVDDAAADRLCHVEDRLG